MHSFEISLLYHEFVSGGLSVQKVLATNIYQLFQFYSQFFGKKRSGACVTLVFKRDIKMEATIEFKRDMACDSVLRIVEGKLRH